MVWGNRMKFGDKASACSIFRMFTLCSHVSGHTVYSFLPFKPKSLSLELLEPICSHALAGSCSQYPVDFQYSVYIYSIEGGHRPGKIGQFESGQGKWERWGKVCSCVWCAVWTKLLVMPAELHDIDYISWYNTFGLLHSVRAAVFRTDRLTLLK